MKKEDILAMSVELTKAHLANNQMDPTEIPNFLEGIHATLLRLHSQEGVESVGAQTPAQEADPKVASLVTEDISAKEFDGLDPWLAHRLTPRIARKLNRDEGALHPTVFPDYLICLEDGKEVKLLRSYLEKHFGLTFVEYMDKWGLPDNYPSSPPSYLAAKRALAEKSGLGSTLRGKRGKARARVKKPV